ncbi:MAG: hypothetical protein R3B90_07110 [Planctomycetaceae bacterium]
MYYYVRHPQSAVVKQLHARLLKCAEGAALATETRLEVVEEGGIVEILPNALLSQVALQQLRELNDLKYDEASTEFALRLQRTLLAPEPLTTISEVKDQSGTVGNGSTDVGDVSWVVPTTGFSTACWVPGTPAHSWQAVACGDTPIARQGCCSPRKCSRRPAELLNNPSIIEQAKQEHQRRRAGRDYQPLIGAEQPPPLDYRRPPSNHPRRPLTAVLNSIHSIDREQSRSHLTCGPGLASAKP